MEFIVLAIVVFCFLSFLCYRKYVAYVFIYEFQKGLFYRKGKFVKLLGAGKYYFLKNKTFIQVIDARKMRLTLQGQEILTKDNITIKISLAGFYEVVDPVKAKHNSENYLLEFYTHAQLVLRDLTGNYTLDELLEKKNEIDARLLEKGHEAGEALGLNISALAIKDIMLSTALKKAFSGIVEARKEAQKSLEKARGEQAVLRNLANSSNMYENNPMLLQARIIQSLASGNNTIVFNSDNKALTLGKSGS